MRQFTDLQACFWRGCYQTRFTRVLWADLGEQKKRKGKRVKEGDRKNVGRNERKKGMEGDD